MAKIENKTIERIIGMLERTEIALVAYRRPNAHTPVWDVKVVAHHMGWYDWTYTVTQVCPDMVNNGAVNVSNAALRVKDVYLIFENFLREAQRLGLTMPEGCPLSDGYALYDWARNHVVVYYM